jgi:hypothetical protein
VSIVGIAFPWPVVAGAFFEAVLFATGLLAALLLVTALALPPFAAPSARTGTAAFKAAGLDEVDFAASFLAGVSFEVLEVGFMVAVLSHLLPAVNSTPGSNAPS